MKTAQTNKDRRRQRRRRRYRLTPAGLASLRAAALRHQPWRRSTGPRTEAGKSRSKLNALKHGQCSLSRRAERQQINDVIRRLSCVDDALPEAAARDERDVWRNRLAREMDDGISRLFERNATCQ